MSPSCKSLPIESATAPVSDKPNGNSLHSSGVPLAPRIHTKAKIEEQKSAWQLDWNTTVRRELDLPQSYEHVTVLIIKWHDEIDELKTSYEVSKLKDLFEKGFHYNTEVCELHDQKNVQLQLDRAVIQFVLDYDGPRNLLLIYYTGHTALDYTGHTGRENGVPIWHANNKARQKDRFAAEARWDRVEATLLKDAEGDILVTMDTCYASNHIKGRADRGSEPRLYELLAASSFDKLTHGPGPESFTTAMISALQALLEEHRGHPFTVQQLCEKINLHPERRMIQSQVWRRLKQYERNIAFGPQLEVEKEKWSSLGKTCATLTLELPLLVESLSSDQIQDLARDFCKAIKHKRLVRTIEWRSLERIEPTRSATYCIMAVVYARKWLKSARAKRRMRPNEKSLEAPPTADHAVQTPLVLEGSARQPTTPTSPVLATHGGSSKRKLSPDSNISSERPTERRAPLPSLSTASTLAGEQCMTPNTEPEQDLD